jgi:hypothetical protein
MDWRWRASAAEEDAGGEPPYGYEASPGTGIAAEVVGVEWAENVGKRAWGAARSLVVLSWDRWICSGFVRFAWFSRDKKKQQNKKHSRAQKRKIRGVCSVWALASLDRSPSFLWMGRNQTLFCVCVFSLLGPLEGGSGEQSSVHFVGDGDGRRSERLELGEAKGLLLLCQSLRMSRLLAQSVLRAQLKAGRACRWAHALPSPPYRCGPREQPARVNGGTQLLAHFLTPW